jgi:quinoprotein glucose dehydrogenase
MPYIDTLIPRKVAEKKGIQPWGEGRNFRSGKPAKPGPPLSTALAAGAGTPFASKVGPFLSPLGYPCHAPPYGHISAVDLRTHQIVWRHPIGTTHGVAPLGISLPMGMFNLGGTLVTRGGLVFIGAVIDGYFRAFDEATGKELWRDKLPVPAQAGPMTYTSPKTGRQFVVIAAGGHTALKTPVGDYVVAYALPTS